MWGKCTNNKNEEPAEGNFAHSLRLEIDKNLIFSRNGENTSQEANRTCSCRTDTRWNEKLLERQVRYCALRLHIYLFSLQMFLDVDCSANTNFNVKNIYLYFYICVKTVRLILEIYKSAGNLITNQS